MKKIVMACVVVLCFSCSKGNGEPDPIPLCGGTSSSSGSPSTSKSSTSTVGEALVLEYIDSDGNNLLENNTYNPLDIFLRYENGIRTEVVDLQNEATKYLVWVTGFSREKNAISVTLSPSETDKMFLYATEVDFSSCAGPLFAIDSVFYNGEKQELKKMSDWIKKVTIIKK